MHTHPSHRTTIGANALPTLAVPNFWAEKRSTKIAQVTPTLTSVVTLEDATCSPETADNTATQRLFQVFKRDIRLFSEHTRKVCCPVLSLHPGDERFTTYLAS